MKKKQFAVALLIAYAVVATIIIIRGYVVMKDCLELAQNQDEIIQQQDYYIKTLEAHESPYGE